LFMGYAIFFIVGFSNAVNLTDGLDGLAGGTTAFATLALGLLAGFQGHTDLAFFAMALVGACIGFLWFNGPPAQVFMGDTGSLALGAAFAGIALFSGTTLFLPILGGVFVAETLSVIIQVVSFKTYGKRVFRMSPLHHHFELGGMLEPQIMLRFWMVGIVLAVLGVLGFLIR
jgi:phospho-N-acetylmuramoyl-pentapeptide-transferase